MIWRRQTKRGLLALALAAAAVAVPVAQAPAAAPQTPKKAMWGPTILPNGTSAFPTYRDLGVGIYQMPVLWHQIAPTKPANPTDPNDPAYVWPASVAKTIAEAQSYGMTVQIMLLGAPTWSNGGRPYKFAPTQPSDFAAFATAISKKYPSVHLWMIWGEPNRAPNFQPLTPALNTPKGRTGPLNAAQQIGPRTYAQLLDAAYGALKAVSPANKVIGGNTFTAAGPDAIYTYQWIKYMKLPGGGRPRMDMWGHNPYGFKIPNLNDPPSPRGIVAFADLRRLVKAIDKARFPGPKKKLFLAEWGVPIGFEDTDLTYSVPPKMGKKWIKAGFRIARSWSRIYTLGWIHLLDTPISSQGLLNSRGIRKVSYNFYKAS